MGVELCIFFGLFMLLLIIGTPIYISMTVIYILMSGALSMNMMTQ